MAGILFSCIYFLIALMFLPFYHSFQSSLLTILGLSDSCGQIPTEVRMVVCPIQDILYIYTGRVYCSLFRERFLKSPLEWSIRKLPFIKTSFSSYLKYSKITQNYDLQTICCCQQVHLHLFLLSLALPFVPMNRVAHFLHCPV